MLNTTTDHTRAQTHHSPAHQNAKRYNIVTASSLMYGNRTEIKKRCLKEQSTTSPEPAPSSPMRFRAPHGNHNKINTILLAQPGCNQGVRQQTIFMPNFTGHASDWRVLSKQMYLSYQVLLFRGYLFVIDIFGRIVFLLNMKTIK